jgi:hypothetical protein
MADPRVGKTFTKGRRINSLAELVKLLCNSTWIYWGNTPKHPSILWHMELWTLRDAVTKGILYVALKKLTLGG